MPQTANRADQLAAHYREHGYCVAENALPAAEVQALIDEAMRLCREEAAKLQAAVPRGKTAWAWRCACRCFPARPPSSHP